MTASDDPPEARSARGGAGETAWGPVTVHRNAAREAVELLRAAGMEVELLEPNLPPVAPPGEAKELARAAREEGAERKWRGDSILLLADGDDAPRALAHLRDQAGYLQLYDLTANDPSTEVDHLVVLWGVRNLDSGARLVLQARVPKAAAEVPSVASIHPAADWHEREAAEMYGIDFAGHPDPRRLLLPDDWDGFPLRKDYEFPKEYHGISCE